MAHPPPTVAPNPAPALAVEAAAIRAPEGWTPTASGMDRPALVGAGASLWKDPGLGTRDMSCDTCHADNARFGKTFELPYPHRVNMASELAGVEEVELVEMVQLCLKVPMKAEPLPWDSADLAALTSYVEERQKGFRHPKSRAAPPEQQPAPAQPAPQEPDTGER